MPERALAELAGRQWGVVSVGQLGDLGLDHRAISRRVQVGRLHRMYRGVYAVGHTVLRREGYWLAAVLACGPGAVLSHRDSGALLGLRASHRSKIDVTTPCRSRVGSAGIDLHRTRHLPPEETTVHRGIPTTTVARTLIDLASALPRRQVERALDEALRQRRLDLGPLLTSLDRRNGRKGTRELRAILDTHTIGTTLTRSGLEEAFLALIARAGLPRPRVNAHVHLPEGRLSEVDFLWPEHRLVVETDGHAWHATTPQREADHAKDAALHQAGYTVLRITDRQIIHEPAAAVARLRAQYPNGSAPRRPAAVEDGGT